MFHTSDCLSGRAGKIRDGTAVVPGGVALELNERLLVAHVQSQIWFQGEHGLMLFGLSALKGKAVGEISSSKVKALLFKEIKGRLITGIIFPKNNGKSLLLHYRKLPTLLLGQATVKDQGSKFQFGADTGLLLG